MLYIMHIQLNRNKSAAEDLFSDFVSIFRQQFKKKIAAYLLCFLHLI